MLGGEVSAPTPRLYVIPGSHPCAAVAEAMRRKGIDFKRVDLLPIVPNLVGPLIYGGSTVPGMRIGGERIVGSRAIMRRLDELAPEPPLLPPVGDPARAGVLEAERWGDEELQDVPRRLLDVAFLHVPSAMESYAAGANLPLPPALLRPGLPVTARLMAYKTHATDAGAADDLAALPGQLDRVEEWIGQGLLGGEEPNAADLQIGSSLALLLSIADVRPLIEGRPAERLAGYLPPVAGEIPAGALPSQGAAAGA